MKTNKLIVVFLILISSMTFGQDLTWQDLMLKDRVKSITEVSYNGKLTANGYEKVQKGWESSWQMDSKTEFDSDGKKIRQTFFNTQSKISRIERFDYTDGEIVSSEMLYHTRTYKYDSLGRLDSMTEINREPIQISASNANIPGKDKKLTYKFEYDETNQLTQKHCLDSTGTIVGVTRYIYDENGRLSKELILFRDYNESYNYSYDTSGQLITKSWFDSDEGLIEKITYAYDNGIKTHEYWENYYDDELDGKISYSFEKGNEKEIIEMDDSANIDAKWYYQYVYDLKDNWIKQIVTIDDDKIFIIERKIEYY